MADQVEKKEFEFPTDVVQAYHQLEDVQRDIESLAKQEKGLKKFLQASIPLTDKDEKGRQFGMLDGIKHMMIEIPAVKYKDALEDTVRMLVPKTKWVDANKIKENHTGDSNRHYLSEPEEEE